MKAIQLPYVPRAWQQDCHRSRRRFTVLALHRRAGKTHWALATLLDAALRCKRQLGLFLYIAPFRTQAKDIAWRRLKMLAGELIRTGLATLSEQELSLTLSMNGATVRLFGADNPDSLRGLGPDGAVVDETAQVTPELWHDVLQPALSDRLGWCVFIGTPNGTNLFSELFYFAASDTTATWRAALYTVYQTDALDPAEVARLRASLPPTTFAREYLCDFTAGGDDQLISLSDIDASMDRHLTEADVFYSPLVMGVDVARFGSDNSVIVLRKGLRCEPPIVMAGLDTIALAARCAHVLHERRPRACFIDAGGGAGVIDRLRQLGHDVAEVPFGGRAGEDKRFVNRRSEMWWLGRDWIRSGGQLPRDQALRVELSAPTYKFDAAGRVQLESKDDLRKRLLSQSSPDRADAFVLTFASPVAPVTDLDMVELPQGTVPPRQPQDTASYDPYAVDRLR